MTPAEQQAVRNILAELRLARERARHLEDRIGDLIDTYDHRLGMRQLVIDNLRKRLELQKRQTRKARDLLKAHTKRTDVLKPLQTATIRTVNRGYDDIQEAPANDARMSA